MIFLFYSMFSGDRLLEDVSGSESWNEPRDVTLTLTYPKSHTGATLTRIEVIVTQTSDASRVFISAGGIGQDSVTLVVKAWATHSFKYQVLFFGIQ